MKIKMWPFILSVSLILCGGGCQKSSPSVTVSENYAAPESATQPDADLAPEPTAAPVDETPVSVRVLLFEDERIKMYYTGIDEAGVHLYVTNSTDDTLSLLFDTIALNGRSYDLSSGEYGSTFIAAQSTSEVIQYILENYDTDLSTLTGTFRYAPEVIDDGEYIEYEGSFVNVDVENAVNE